MKENLGNEVLNLVIERRNEVSSLIKQQFKSQPFASEKVSTEKQLWAFDNLGMQDMQDLINEFGKDALNQKIYQISKLRRK